MVCVDARGMVIKSQADQLFKSGMLKEAAQAYTLALRDMPTNATLFNNRSLVFHRLGKFELVSARFKYHCLQSQS